MKLHRCSLAVVSLLVCAIPLQVQAAPTLNVTTKDTPKSQRATHATGRRAAESGDAEGAVEAWAQVLASTQESSKTRRFRMNLIVDTANVALDAHAQAPNRALLERTLDVYYEYFAAYEAEYGTPNIPGPVVKVRFALKAALDDAEEPAPTPAPAVVDAEPSEPPPPTPPPGPPPGVSLSSDDMRRGDGTGLMIAGGVTMAVGAGLTSLIAVGAINRKNTQRDLDNPDYSAAQRDDIKRQNHNANVMFIAGLASAPAALITGGVLLGVGGHRRANSRGRYASVTPAMSSTFAGLQIHGRF
jgi:hypothetical protein